MSYLGRKTCPKYGSILHTYPKWSKDSISKLERLQWSWRAEEMWRVDLVEGNCGAF